MRLFQDSRIQDRFPLLTGLQGHRLRKLQGSVSHFQHAGDRMKGMVHQSGAGIDGRPGRIRQGQGRMYERILDRDRAGIGNPDIIVDADIPAPDCRNPVPADGGMHCRIVQPEDAAVLVRGIGRLEFDHAVRRILQDPHRQVVLTLGQDAGHIEIRRPEGSVNQTQRLGVQIDFCLVIDALEMEELPVGIRMRLEHIPVPEVGTEIRIGYK